METDNIESKIKGWFSKGAKASKNAIEKAGDKVQEFTDKSVLKIEKKQLETKQDENYLKLGKYVSDLMIKGLKITTADEADSKEVAKIQKEIVSLTKQIAEKDKEINS